MTGVEFNLSREDTFAYPSATEGISKCLFFFPLNFSMYSFIFFFICLNKDCDLLGFNSRSLHLSQKNGYFLPLPSCVFKISVSVYCCHCMQEWYSYSHFLKNTIFLLSHMLFQLMLHFSAPPFSKTPWISCLHLLSLIPFFPFSCASASRLFSPPCHLKGLIKGITNLKETKTLTSLKESSRIMRCITSLPIKGRKGNLSALIAYRELHFYLSFWKIKM